MEQLRIREPDDWHCHLRSKHDLLPRVLGNTASEFRRALIMGNVLGPDGMPDPVLTARQARDYAADIAQVKAECGHSEFEALLTILLTDDTTPTMIYDAVRTGVLAGKLFPVDKKDPRRAVSNSIHGVSDFGKRLDPVLSAMQEAGLVLCLHGENPASQTVLDAEREFLPTLVDLARRFPRLRIVLEHVSSREAFQLVRELPETVAATITVHHLRLLFEEVVGNKLHPHHFCKPVAKLMVDRGALVQAAISGSPKFFLGTDSAPHTVEKKQSSACPPGVFMTKALPLLAETFAANNALDKLEAFTSEFGARFYNLVQNEGHVLLRQEPQPIEKIHNGIVPYLAGETVTWTMVRDD